MQNEVVIVTTYQRDELLFLCLEAIRRADAEIPIVVFSDRGASSQEFENCCRAFNTGLTLRACHNHYGNSWNLIQGCRWALGEMTFEGQLGSRSLADYSIIHLIEDDTIIHPGYLEWARYNLGLQIVYADGKPDRYAAVCGRIGSPHIQNWYDAPCASWNADYLRQALTMIPESYFSPDRKEMQRALDRKFPRSKYARGGAEQDGFFLRCIEHFKWRTCFPPKPLAQHVGSYGYNRHGHEAPKGELEERIAWTRALLRDKKRRTELFGKSITESEMAGEHQ